MKRIGYIYCLKDASGIPFYVGGTVWPHIRIRQHICAINSDNKFPVYKYMREKQIIPSMEILEQRIYKKKVDFLDAEAKWIKKLKKKGYHLTNVSLTKGTHRVIEPGTERSMIVKIDARVAKRARIVALRLGISFRQFVTDAITEANARHMATLDN
jgi:predicted HicB family RNase H-like nuclease